MTVPKNPKYKADKRIKRELARYVHAEISEEEYKRRVITIQEYYEVEV